MKSYFDLYGFFGVTIDDVAANLEKALATTFVARDSSYKGEYYNASGEGDENFDLEENFNKIEKDWTEPDFEQYPVILYVSDTRNAHEIEARMQKVMGKNMKLLRREEVQSQETLEHDIKI